MKFFRVSLAAGMGIACIASTSALAEGAPAPDRIATQQYLICDRDAGSRRAFVRTHHQRPVFVTAGELINSRVAPTAVPQCITGQQYARLVRAQHTARSHNWR